MFRLLFTFAVLTVAIQLFAAEIPDRYWPRWRGPVDSGNAAFADCPEKWSKGRRTSLEGHAAWHWLFDAGCMGRPHSVDKHSGRAGSGSRLRLDWQVGLDSEYRCRSSW